MTFDIHQPISDEDGEQHKQETEPPKAPPYSYTPPVDRLLSYTNIREGKPLPKISYIETFGISPEHIPELLRMAADDYLASNDANDFEFAAGLHAVSALAELHAEEAIEPLLAVYDKSAQNNNEWMRETLVDVFTTLGPVALPALEQFLADPSHEDLAQGYVAETIGRMAKKHPEARAECIAVITRRLADFELNSIDLNTSLIISFIDMQAVEAAALIQEALASNRVDESWCGDWEEIQYELGMKERPVREEEPSLLSFLTHPKPNITIDPKPNIVIDPKPKKKAPPSKKTKTKMANASKKVNRKKK